MNYKILAVLILCIGAVAVTGCMGLGTSGADTRTTTVQGTISPTNYDASSIYTEKMSSAGGAVPVPTSANAGTTGTDDTKIIKTGYITVEVKDVAASVESLKNLAAEKSGYLSSTSMQTGDNNRLRAR